jgi:hypothetical protein
MRFNTVIKTVGLYRSGGWGQESLLDVEGLKDPKG